MIKRVATGIPGLDTIMKGGIPEKDLLLLSGQSGMGKTILSLQFLYTCKENGIYVSFEEPLEQLRSTASAFGWGPDKNDKVRLLKYDPFKLEDIFEVIENNIRESKAKRVVIDSISTLGIYMKDPSDLRRIILQISNMLRKNNCTSILVSEIVEGGHISRFGVEEFVTDGVVILKNIFDKGEYRRGINVWKLRGTDHSRRIHPYKITSKGVSVHSSETMKF